MRDPGINQVMSREVNHEVVTTVAAGDGNCGGLRVTTVVLASVAVFLGK